ncbi:MAG: sodium:calcium antiporter [Syntrophomonadaceae bacterium]|nr:sodium:calcium antiporter [Syntrophomonadaceae bacterium]
MKSIAVLVISLGVILIGAELFTNAVEWLGKKLNLSEGAVGSVLAAVGTALPETMIPLIALIGGGAEAVNIGTGAILGAPLMLSTLAMFVTGISIVLFRRRREHGLKVTANPEVVKRDLGVFLIVFAAALLAGTMPPEMRKWQLIVATAMILSYFLYLIATLRDKREPEQNQLSPCYFAPRMIVPRLRVVLLQLAVALAFIIGGARLFVGAIETVALAFGVPAFVLSLVIAPVATELPEKFNSVLWVSRGKDTLALGNITGAMVFQGTLIPALGIFLTDWQLGAGALLSGALALISSAILYVEVLRRQHTEALYLILAGVFYVIFFFMVIEGIIR